MQRSTTALTRTLVGTLWGILSSLAISSQADGIEVEASYTADILANVSGGLKSGRSFLDNLDVVLQGDLEPVLGLAGSRFVLYGLYNNGKPFSERFVGDAQVVSNIETPVRAARLFEAYLEVPVGERGSLLLGLYDLNSEFDVLEAGNDFLHSAHGIGTDIGQSGLNGPSIFPVSSLAARGAWQFNDQWSAKAAVLDAVPGDPEDPAATRVHLRREEGALAIIEVERAWEDARLLLGAWGYSKKREHDRRSNGQYLRGEWRFGEKLAAFARLGVAERRVNPFSIYAGAGLIREGVWQADDRLGLAVAWAEAPHDRPGGFGGETLEREDREIAWELTYRFPVTKWLTLQPDLQYVVNPGLAPDLANAFIVGIRMDLELL